MFTVSFYTPKGKKSPISKYLNRCNEALRAKVLRQLKYVQEYGLTPAVPNLRKLTGTPLWELRILGKDNVRIVCVSLTGKNVKVLHIFTKKKQKTPQKELNVAIKRLDELTDDI